MLCKKPFGYFGCGQCLPCRINRRNLWTGRMMLELLDHPASSFVTLTFQDQHLPEVWDARQWTLFAKRLRFFRGPFRFYAVGERGSKTGRPHFHAALFGVSVTEEEAIIRAWRGHRAGVRNPAASSVGGVHIGELNHDSASYLCKYMCKPWEDKPIVRMSRRPYGIGAKGALSIADGLLSDSGSRALAGRGDVPSEVRVAGKKYPLGRYLRGRVRLAVGWDECVPVGVRRGIAAEKSRETRQELVRRSNKRKASALNAEARVRIAQSKEILT